MPINPVLSDSSVGKGRFMKWQAPKKSERAHLNDFDYSSPQPCLWFWKGGEYSGFCLWTDANPGGQAGNRRARRGERDRHGAIMKMNANGGKGNHGRSRSMKKGVLKKMCSKSSGSLNVTRYKWVILILRFQYCQTRD